MPIRQVHIFCHGDSSWLSLAYHFDQGRQLLDRARAINGLGGTEDYKALESLKQEDAVVTGFLSRVLNADDKARIKTNHATGASWQIWGCFSGYPSTSFDGDPDDADLDKYFKRFNFGQHSIDGIAVEIAKTFGITCTAAQGNGLEFWIGRGNGQIEPTTTTSPPIKPFWMWLTRGSDWKSFNNAGSLRSKANLFGRDRSTRALPTPRPPDWLTRGYYHAAPAEF